MTNSIYNPFAPERLRKPKTFRSEKYLNFIREHPCVNCGRNYPCHAHHESLGEGQMGGKAPDTHAIPLCWACHTARHSCGISTLWRINIPMKIIEYLTEYLDLLESGKGYNFDKHTPKEMEG